MAVVLVRVSSALLVSYFTNILIWITKRANKMGIPLSQIYFQGNRPSVLPASNEKPTFDPQYGFKKERLPRVSRISEEEMKALKIPKNQRDYCAHIWKDFLVCSRDYKPLIGLCKPELHAYEHCQIEDFTLRMKEYEREKRLRIRAAKKEQAVS